MVKRLTLAVVALSSLLAALPISAQEQATLVLRSGERVSGELIDFGGTGFAMRVNGQNRQISQNEVAVVEFSGSAQPNNDVQNKLNAGQQVIVLRNGQVIDGRLVDIGGTSPLRLAVDTPSGQRNLNSSEVAQLFLANPSGGAMSGGVATSGENGVTTITVPGNQEWTSTNRVVRGGEVLAISASGQVRFSPNPDDTAQAGGAGRQRMGPGAPLASAPKGALLGRIDQGQPFLIGDQRQARMPANGTLYLGLNDDMVSDNSGSLQVTISDAARARRR
jgi:hypothetical protein